MYKVFNILESEENGLRKTRKIHEVLKVPAFININRVIDYLNHDRFSSGSNGKKVFDYIKDFPMVYASFIMAYPEKVRSIDDIKKMDWVEFKWLLQGILMNDQFPISQVVSIRSTKEPAPTKYNGAQLAAIRKNKAKWSLVKEGNGLGALFRSLEAIAVKKE